MTDNELKKVLIIQVSRIGDTLFVTPAIRTIAEYCPNAEITVLAHPNRRGVFDHLPFINHLGVIEKNRAIFKGWFFTKKYDLAFVYGFDQALIKFAFRVSKKVIAFQQESEILNTKLYKVVEKPNTKDEHAVQQLLRLPKSLGWDSNNLRLAMHITLSEFKKARMQLESLYSEHKSPFIVGLQIASFPTKSYRDWPVDFFLELALQIKLQIPAAHFLIYGGKAERDRTSWLHNQLSTCSTHLAGELSLRQTAAFMGLSNFYIGIDTGPTHMMSTFNIPMVVLYHCLHPSTIYKPLDHPACKLVDLKADFSCERTNMSKISVQEVLLAVNELIKQFYPLLKISK